MRKILLAALTVARYTGDAALGLLEKLVRGNPGK